MRKLLPLILIIFSTKLIAQQNNLIQELSIAKNKEIDSSFLNDAEFAPLFTTKLGPKNGSYWFKVLLKQEALTQNEIILNFKEPSIKKVKIYSAKSFIAEQLRKKGETNIHIQLSKPVQRVYYLNIQFSKQVNVTIEASNFTAYQNDKNKTHLYAGLYYGIVFMVFCFNLIFFFTSKDKTFLYYCLFLGAINLSFTGFDGMLYLLFDFKELDDLAIVCHFLIQLFGAIFAASFLNLNTRTSKYKLVPYSLIAPLVFYISYFVTDRFLFVAIGDILGMIILTIYWILGIVSIKNNRFSSFFVIGYSMILFAGFLFLIPMNFGLFEGVTFNQLKLGAFFEMLVLTYAITYRAKKVQEENNTIQIELKKYILQATELESKLKESNSKTQNKSTTEKRVSEISESYNLTARETDILLHISLGKNNQQIADELFISINTVKYHTRNMYEKLDIKKRSEVTSKILFDK